MSSRAKEKTPSKAKTPARGRQESSTSSRVRSPSPLSPTCTSRVEEKNQLQSLNDRLANYIDRNRKLEAENSKLYQIVQTSQETLSIEKTNVKNLYEQELDDARRLLDQTANEKARLQIELKKVSEERDELLVGNSRLDRKLGDAEKTIANLEGQLRNLNQRCDQLAADKKKLVDDNKDLTTDNAKLRKQLNECQKQLEQETLSRVDFENRYQTAQEDLLFKKQEYEQTVKELRSQKNVEVTEIDGRLQEEYEARLSDQLTDLRSQYEDMLKGNREDLENRYEDMIAEKQSRLDELQESSTGNRDRMNETRTQLDTVMSKLSEYEAANASLQNRVRDLENRLSEERATHDALLKKKDDRIKQYQDQIEQQLRDFQDLIDVKTTLDREIQIYRNLLDAEDTRLDISAQQRDIDVSVDGTPTTGGKGVKRRRTVMRSEEVEEANFVSTSTASTPIEIQEEKPTVVTLKNRGDDDIALGSWTIKRTSGEDETVYKFHNKFVLKTGATVRVHNTDVVGVDHKPPDDLVMKGKKWALSESIDTQLINTDGESVAKRVSHRAQKSAQSVSRPERGVFRPIRREELYHQQGDPENRENCVLM